MQLILIKIILQAITFVTLCVSAVPVEDLLCSVAKQPPDGKYSSAVPSVCELCVSLSPYTHIHRGRRSGFSLSHKKHMSTKQATV